MARGSQRGGSISGLRTDDGGGVAIAYVDADGAASVSWGKWDGWPSRLAVRSTCPQHSDAVADCLVLGCGLSPSVRRVGGGVHVADDDYGGEHGHLAVCRGQGLEEGFRGVAEGDVGVDDVGLPSVPDDLIDT